MSHGRLGVVFLGCGWATAIHSRVLRRLPGGGLDLLYASRDASRADEYRRRYGGLKSFGGYDAALADPSAHVAIVATPTVTHRELALLALQAGKHVIVEKPAFMRSADADVVQEAAKKAGRRVLVAENYFYKPMAEHLRQVIGAGDIGDVRFVNLNTTKQQRADDWRGDPSLSGGGALFEAGVHWINFMSNIGLEVADARGFRVGTSPGPDRSSLVVFRYTNGAVGTLAHSWELKAPFGGARLSKVQGTRGSVTFESNGFAYVTTGRRKRFGLPVLADPLGYRAMHTDFFGALRDDRPARFTLEMAKRDLQLLEQAAETMDARQPVLPGPSRNPA